MEEHIPSLNLGWGGRKFGGSGCKRGGEGGSVKRGGIYFDPYLLATSNHLGGLHWPCSQRGEGRRPGVKRVEVNTLGYNKAGKSGE